MRLLSDLISDARLALRQMRQRPGFTATVLTALGLGIGASVALVSVVASLLLRSLPYADEARVRVFWQDYSWTDEEYDFLRARLGAFDELAAFSTAGATYSPNPGSPQPASVLPVVVSTPTLFAVLGARPMLGRVYNADDDRPEAAPVAVISYGMWQQDLGGDARVIGRRIVLDGRPATVIGVMPRGFFFPNPDLRVWRPLQLGPSSQGYQNGYLTLVARTRREASDALVNSEMQRLARALGKRFTYPAAWDSSRNAAATPVHSYVLGKVREPLLLLLGAVMLLLLIASANAAALILARSTDRTSEMAVRKALGASTWRLARQILVEAFVLAACAAVIGTALAMAGFRMLVARLPLAGGLDSVTTIGSSAFAAALALSLLITLVVSIVPVRRVMRGGPGGSVSRERSEQGLHRGARRVHATIIGLQVTFAMLLVIGATLLVRSVERIRDIDPGFDARGVTTYTVFAGTGIAPAVRGPLYTELLTRIGALPGVASAGLINRLPVRDLGYQTGMTIEGRPELTGTRKPTSLYRTATPGLFRALGMHIVAGRGVDSTDVDGSSPVAVVSESFANAMWPGQNPLGKHVTESWSGQKVSRTVVGVMRETHLTGLTTKSPFALWVPLAQSGSSQVGGVLVVKSSTPAATIMPAVRNAVGATDSRLAIARSQTMQDAVDTALSAPLRLRFFFTMFAALALSLGAIGVFGVVSYAVARRRAEFAVRMALGATPRTVGREVLRFGLAPVVIGVAAGSLAAIGGMKLVRGFLYDVAPTDGVSFGLAAVALLAVGALAALLPAVRAGRTSPAEALRADSA
jgi:putative ABC transport system permease protein